MRKVREVLRLKHALGMSYRKISEATGVGKTQAAEYVRRAEAAGIAWPVPEGLGNAALDGQLFPVAGDSERARPAIDGPKIAQELKRRGVTLALLWQEYLAEHPNGYSYTRFCELYGAWKQCVSPTMRQTHLAGEKLFVDWAGDTIGVINPATGEEHRARIFVAALGASNYTYAEARWTETLPDWIGAHVNALNAIGGVPKAAVPDNLKAGITSCRRRASPRRRRVMSPASTGPTRISPIITASSFCRHGRGSRATSCRKRASPRREGRGCCPDRRTLCSGEAAQQQVLLARRVERRHP